MEEKNFRVPVENEGITAAPAAEKSLNGMEEAPASSSSAGDAEKLAVFEGITYRVSDESYVIQKNGHPYHVPKTPEFMEEWEKIHTYAETNPDEVETEYPPEPVVLTLEQVKADAIAAINEEYEASARKLRQDTPNSEIMTWDIQKIEAEAWKLNPDNPTPFCDGIAAARSTDREVLLGKVLIKAATFNEYISMLTGLRQRCEDLILAAETQEAAEAVTWDGALEGLYR